MRRLILLAAAAPSFSGVLDQFGVAAVFFFVLVENFGVPIPGETMLVFASAYAAAGHINIALVVLACIVGVFSGTTLSYFAGRSGGVALMTRLHVPERHLARAEGYIARWGGYTVLFGRYIAFLRSYLGWLAGINKMATGPFLLWNLVGSVLWTLTFATLGYLVGNNWALIERIFKVIGYGGGALVVILIVAALFFKHRLESRAVAPAPVPVQDDADEGSVETEITDEPETALSGSGKLS